LPKLKTNKTAAKRFTITGSGKLLRTKGGKSHLRRRKPARVKRQYDEMLPVDRVDQKRIKTLLPYSK